jgi:hypothetical protein
MYKHPLILHLVSILDVIHAFGVYSALVRVNEELLERKLAAPVYKTEINDCRGSAALTMRHPFIHKSWY